MRLPPRLVVLRDVPVLHRDDAVALRERQLGKDVAVEEGEEPRAHGDRHRHTEPADDREPRVLDEHARAQLDVEPREAELVEGAEPPRATRLGLVVLHAAELHPCQPLGLVRRDALPHEVRRAQLDVMLELLAHLALDVGTAPRPAPERARAGQE